MQVITGEDLKEKREKFIAGRLAEHSYFGRPNIETWLAEQKTAETPDNVVWAKLLTLVHRPELATLDCDWGALQDVLEKVGFPVAFRESCVLEECIREHVQFAHKISPYLEHFPHKYNNEVFLSFSSLLLTQRNYNNPLVIMPGKNEEGVIWETLRIADVLDSARLSWTILPEGGRKSDARECLCDWLQKGIIFARKEAGKAFDDAVGVSEDGSNILHVDWVFMVRPNGTCRITKNECFRMSKFLRPTHFVHHNNPIHFSDGVVPNHMKEILSVLAERSLWDVQSNLSGEKQILFYVAFDGYNARLEKCFFCQIDDEGLSF